MRFLARKQTLDCVDIYTIQSPSNEGRNTHRLHAAGGRLGLGSAGKPDFVLPPDIWSFRLSAMSALVWELSHLLCIQAQVRTGRRLYKRLPPSF